MRNPPSCVLLAAAVGVLLLVGVVAPAAGGAAASPSVSPAHPAVESSPLESQSSSPTVAAVSPSAMAEQADDGFNPTTATRIRIELASDRDARWIVSIRYPLTNEIERAAFETVGDRFQTGEIGPSADLFSGFAREASQNLNRTMQIEGAEREVVVHEDTSSFDVAGEDAVAVGELRLSFVWTAFLMQDGEELVLGDALTTPDGTWLQSLEPGQTLEVATPDGYTVTSTTASLQDNTVVIEGPQTFDEGDGIAVVYASTETPEPPWTMLTAAIVISALIIAGSIVGYRRRGGDAPGDDAAAAGDAAVATTGTGASGTGDTSADDAGADDRTAADTDKKRDSAATEPRDTAESDDSGESGVSGEGEDAPEATSPSDAASAGSDPDGSGSTDESDSADDSEQTDEIDRSLLSDEERVEHLLDDNGGRMRQADIVSETGWSDAKVSQLLSAMADENRIEKLRLGRENLISLSDSEGDAGVGGNDDDSQSGGDTESGGDR